MIPAKPTLQTFLTTTLFILSIGFIFTLIHDNPQDILFFTCGSLAGLAMGYIDWYYEDKKLNE